jgi:hypothetical protein
MSQIAFGVQDAFHDQVQADVEGVTSDGRDENDVHFSRHVTVL